MRQPPLTLTRGTRARSPVAANAATSRGRLVAEQDSPTRTPFQRDRDRIVHSTAFRRLAHKTQVFVPFEGDHFRTRLTHTLEVAQIARAFARGLGLDDDLAEALALAHDLGHTPFGHTGEDVLQEQMARFGGFDHNAQALRIVTRLESRYAKFDGLNLAWETLEGLVKHNGPLLGPFARHPSKPVARPILDFDKLFPLDLASFAGAEAQAAALADDVAYNSHDIDDGLRAGLFTLKDLRDGVPHVHRLLSEIERLHPGLDQTHTIHELVRRIITQFVEDVLTESERRINAIGAAAIDDIRKAEGPSIAFSRRMEEADRDIKRFLFPAMYRHRDVVRVREKAAHVLTRLFPHFLGKPGALPGEWASAAAAARDETARARVVCDYIAGMTDRYALGEYVRLFGETIDLK